MKHGDFTSLAQNYIHRPGYSLQVLSILKDHITAQCGPEIVFADVGAGQGKLTENLLQTGLTGFAVEPNDAMRNEGIRLLDCPEKLTWQKGSAEHTNLPDQCVNWALMGSSFHWTDKPKAMSEFARILKPGGFFTAAWNPRDIENSPFHQKVEKIIKSIIPDLKRVSSGAKSYTQTIEQDLVCTGEFSTPVFMEAVHTVEMSKERYLGVWRSVNDIQVQAGPERFERIMDEIQDLIQDMDKIISVYRTRAWTVQKKS